MNKSINVPADMFSSEQTLNLLRDRWDSWVNEGLPDCDQLLLDVLPRFNKNIDLITVFGCAGHMDSTELDSLDSSIHSNHAYIMFAANAKGTEWLFKFHHLLLSQFPKKEMSCMIDLSFGYSGFPLYDCIEGNIHTYPTVILKAHFNKGIYDQRDFFEALHFVLNRLDVSSYLNLFSSSRS